MSPTAARRLVVVLTGALVLSACSVEPPKRTVSRARGTPPVSSPAPVPAARADGGSYTVVHGDTLYSIAFRNQLDFHDLADWNGIGRDYAIRVGQVLRLTPPGQVALAPERSPAAVSTPPAAPAAAPSPPARVPARIPPVAAAAVPTPTSTPAAANPGPADTPRTDVAPPSTPRRINDGGWEWPTRGRVVRSFGSDTSAKGIDITGERGQIVIASRAGKVVYSGTALKGYGELIIIKHDEQYLSAYGYNRRRLVNEGDTVAAGQPIAEMGDGPEQRPLLHYEIREKGRPVDPAQLLPAR